MPGSNREECGRNEDERDGHLRYAPGAITARGPLNRIKHSNLQVVSGC